jgi:D-methionine transport system permease protein
VWDSETVAMFLQGIVDTLYMTVVSTLLAYLIGLPLGVLLVVTAKNGIRPNRLLNSVLGTIVNLLRSVPFLILLLLLLPFTELIVHTSIGPTAMIVSLTIAAFPFVGRLVESSLNEVDAGVIEAARSMGASVWQIIYRVMIPESVPSLARGAAIAVTTILGYSAMAGVCGGGGLGDIAIRYGMYRYEFDMMFVTVIILVVLVQIFQVFGNTFARRADKRK